jgi:hypothetical protein
MTDIDPFEGIVGIASHGRQRFEIPGVGELVDIYDTVRGVVDNVPDHGRANEAGAACY